MNIKDIKKKLAGMTRDDPIIPKDEWCAQDLKQAGEKDTNPFIARQIDAGLVEFTLKRARPNRTGGVSMKPHYRFTK